MLEVLFEDNHLLVICKPAGLPTIGESEMDTSVVSLAKQMLKRKYNKPGNVYLGVVSRLDAPTTGILVLARTSKAASRLSEQFRIGSVEKQYLAIVERRPPRFQATLIHWLSRDEKQRRQRVSDIAPERSEIADFAGSGPRGGIAGRHDSSKYIGQRAELTYQCIGLCRGEALLRVVLHSGRKHQIRAQLAHIGCPILGDRKYGAMKSAAKSLSKRSAGSEIALHSWKLAFEHPTKRHRMELTCPPPEHWQIDRFN